MRVRLILSLMHKRLIPSLMHISFSPHSSLLVWETAVVLTLRSLNRCKVMHCKNNSKLQITKQ